MGLSQNQEGNLQSFMLSVFVAVFALCAQASESKWITPDFKIVTIPSEIKPMAVYSGSCYEKIANAVCLVDPAGDGNEPRPCLAESTHYVRYFHDLYDRYPPHLKKNALPCEADLH